jgi:acyl-CoA synthetase (AMP-forming)/AMP-acid ligase II/acyl carrier protein
MTQPLATPSGSNAAPATVAALLRMQAEQRPDQIALIAPGRAGLRYRDLWAQAQALAPAWSALAPAGGPPRIATALAGGSEMAAAWLAVAASATCIPLDPAARPAELRALLVATGAHAVLIDAQAPTAARDVARELGLSVIEVVLDPARPVGTLELASAPLLPARAELPQLRPDDTVLIVRTSGTTGEPKMVELTQEMALSSARTLAGHFGLSPADCSLNTRPMFHVAGLIVNTLSTVVAGARMLSVPMQDPDAFFDAIARYEPTWFSGVPTMHQWLLAHAELYRRKAPHHRFRFLRSAASSLPPATLHKLEALTGAPVVETYGMSERTPIAGNPMPPGVRKPGTVGFALGVELDLLDAEGRSVPPGVEGEVTIRGPVAGTQPGQWFRTGDLGRFDEDGYLCLTGRVKDLINRGGQKLLPREIEDALLEYPGVMQAAAFRVAHPTLGEDVAAAIVPAAGAAPQPAQLREFLLSRLAPYKVPATFIFIDALPVNASGKVKRDTLTALAAAQAAAATDDAVGETERRIAAIVGELLGAASVPRDASFFALGGDSLAAARVMARVGRAFDIEAAVDLLFRHPTVAELASAVDALVAAAQQRIADEIDSLSDEEVMRLLAEEEAASGPASEVDR